MQGYRCGLRTMEKVVWRIRAEAGYCRSGMDPESVFIRSVWSHRASGALRAFSILPRHLDGTQRRRAAVLIPSRDVVGSRHGNGEHSLGRAEVRTVVWIRLRTREGTGCQGEGKEAEELCEGSPAQRPDWWAWPRMGRLGAGLQRRSRSQPHPRTACSSGMSS